MIKRAAADRCCGSLAANGLSILATRRFELLINSQARLDGGAPSTVTSNNVCPLLALSGHHRVHCTCLLFKADVTETDERLKGTYSHADRFSSLPRLCRRIHRGGTNDAHKNEKGTFIGNRRADGGNWPGVGAGPTGGRLSRRIRARNVFGVFSPIARLRRAGWERNAWRRCSRTRQAKAAKATAR